MKKRRFRIWLAAGVLVLVHLAALGAGWIAPYDYMTQHREFAFSPPTKLRFVDRAGRFAWRPFVEIPKPAARSVAADRGASTSPELGKTQLEMAPVRLFVRRAPRKIGPWVVERRLFGVEEPAQLFLLGTDALGRDIFSRLLYGARVSLFAGFLAGGVSALLGFVLGVAAGFLGGRVDEALMRFTELFLALPWLYLLFGIRALLPLELGPVQAFSVFVLIVGGIGWARPARLFRGVASAVRERDFVLAARGLGATDVQLVWRHVLPQTLGVFWTQFALLVPRFILAEVTLSFLGLGVGEPMPSWGNMLTGARSLQVLSSYSWTLAPAVALLIVVLCYEPLTDRLRERGQSGLSG